MYQVGQCLSAGIGVAVNMPVAKQYILNLRCVISLPVVPLSIPHIPWAMYRETGLLMMCVCVCRYNPTHLNTSTMAGTC